MRVLSIWQDRNVYTADFIDELRTLLANGVVLPSVSKIVAEFKLQSLLTPIEEVREIEKKAKLSITQSNAKLDVLNLVLNRLKDKSDSEHYSKECDDAVTMLEVEIQSLEKEISARNKLMSSLEKGQIYYETQREEAATVAGAYAALYSSVCAVKKKLEDASKYFNSSDANKFNSVSAANNSHNSFQNNNIMSQFQPPDSHKNASSLDQRLSNLMGGIVDPAAPAAGMPFATSGRDRSDMSLPTALQNMLQLPPQNSANPSSSFFMQPAPVPPPPPSVHVDHPSAPHSNANLYEPSRYAGLSSHSAPFHQIQSVISTRMDAGMGIAAVPHGQIPNINPYSGYSGSHENFEPADMDLGNSDDDDSQRPSAYIPSRANNNLKVIEPQRHHEGFISMQRRDYDLPPPRANDANWPPSSASGPRSVIASRHNYNPQNEAFQLISQNDYRKTRSNQPRNNRRGAFPR